MSTPGLVSVVPSTSWSETRPYAQYYAPGSPGYNDPTLKPFNSALLEGLKSCGYPRFIPFIVVSPEREIGGGRGVGKFFELWICEAARPDHMARIVPIQDNDGTPRKLDDRVYDSFLGLTECAGRLTKESLLRADDMARKANEKLAADNIADAKGRMHDELMAARTADPDSPIIRETRSEIGESRQFRGMELEKPESDAEEADTPAKRGRPKTRKTLD